VATKLRAVFDGPVSISADVLNEGPAAEMDDDEWWKERAKYLASLDPASIDDIRQTLESWDDVIARAAEHDDTVLWFEHDLFDQLALIRTLARLDSLRGAARPGQVALICINAYLGHLTPEQLHALWPTRAPITGAQYAIAHRVWQAFRQPDPTELLRAREWLKTERDYCLPTPFLGDALERFFEEFPSTTNGLSRTADELLHDLAESPALSLTELFRRTQAREARMFLGDSSFFQIVAGLARAQVPLVAIAEPLDSARTGNPGSQRISITDAGREVSRCERDAVRLNGIDVWRGGVHLSGSEAAWRWDPGRKTLISCK
jgi:hypothetical protein